MKHSAVKRMLVLGLVVTMSTPICYSYAETSSTGPTAGADAQESVQSGNPLDHGTSDSATADALEQEKERVRKRIHMIRIWRLTSELNLNENTARDLFPILNAFQERRGQLMAEGRRIERMLAAEIGRETHDERTIQSLLDDYRLNEKRKYELYREESTKLESLLTPKQLAQYILFGQRFNMELQYIFREALSRAVDTGSPSTKVKRFKLMKPTEVETEETPK
ncbi:MAG: hypothetical protein HY788_14320 [Deltaproteobacteria bacterium]|nr:hypothetical protein [Deltaproteobacteria bacterium]